MPSKPTSPKTPIAPRMPAQKATIHQSVFDALPDSAFIREAQLVQSPKRPDTPAPLPFSGPTLWRKVKAGTFPKPSKLSERVTAWNVGSVRAWMLAQATTLGAAVTQSIPNKKASETCDSEQLSIDTKNSNTPSAANEGKAFSSLAASFELTGHTLSRSDPVDGASMYYSTRGNMSRALPDLQAAMQFLAQIGSANV